MNAPIILLFKQKGLDFSKAFLRVKFLLPHILRNFRVFYDLKYI